MLETRPFFSGRPGWLRYYTLRLIDPMFSVIETRAKRIRFSTVGYFEKGELTRRIYAALRRSESITAAGVAAIRAFALMSSRGSCRG